MSIHYGFIARDTDMFIFETVISKDLNIGFKREAK